MFARSISIKILVCVIIILMTGVLLIDLNDFKPDIEALVKKQTGRTLVITGDLGFSLFPELKVTVGKMLLSNSKAFSEPVFAELAGVEIKLKLLSLGSGKIDIKSISVNGLTLYLITNQQGLHNWDDLMQANPVEEVDHFKHTLQSVFALLVFDHFRLEHSQLVWVDQSTEQQLKFADLDMAIDNQRSTQSVPVSLSFTLQQAHEQATQAIQLNTELFWDEQLNTLTAKHSQFKHKADVASIPEFMLNVNTVEYQYILPALTVSGVHLHSEPLDVYADLSGAQVKNQFVVQGHLRLAEFNPKQLFEKWQIAVPAAPDHAVWKRALADVDLQVTAHSAQFTGFKLVLDQTVTTGNMQVNDFNKPLLNLAMTADSLDLDRYLAPKKQDAATVPMLSSAAIAAQAQALWMPIERLKKITIEGQLAIQQLTVNQLKMQGVVLELQSQ